MTGSRAASCDAGWIPHPPRQVSDFMAGAQMARMLGALGLLADRQQSELISIRGSERVRSEGR